MLKVRYVLFRIILAILCVVYASHFGMVPLHLAVIFALSATFVFEQHLLVVLYKHGRIAYY